ncbi:MAG: hypothetical protein IT338_03580 [Thermomicrobiales bacterium]|nr:hypothetical protein [Thermomicrobiales bacterium]
MAVRQWQQAVRVWRVAAVLALAILLLAGIAASQGGASLAQEGEATPGTPAPIDFTQLVTLRPAEIRAGACTNPGETIAELEPLEKPEGEAEGQGGAIEAERSYTSVPITIQSLLESETNISILLSDSSDVVVACGEIGGVVTEGGSLVLKLSEQNDSGFSGIAFLGTGDGGTTGISLFLAGERTVAETRELAAVATPTEALTPIPEPTPTAEPVQVADIALLEWLIDMPQEIHAGQVNLVVTNEGAEPHSLVIESGGAAVAQLPRPLDPGQSTILSVDLAPGEYTLYCPEEDGEHREKGMEGTLEVEP